jgi:hypothetical protein
MAVTSGNVASRSRTKCLIVIVCVRTPEPNGFVLNSLKQRGTRHTIKHFVNAARPSRSLCERRRHSARCVAPLIWHRIPHERRGDSLSSAGAQASRSKGPMTSTSIRRYRAQPNRCPNLVLRRPPPAHRVHTGEPESDGCVVLGALVTKRKQIAVSDRARLVGLSQSVSQWALAGSATGL